MPTATRGAESTRPEGYRIPFREFVVKVNARCNMACDYCYMYEAVDRSALTKTAAMSAETTARTMSRIAEHSARHALTQLRVVFHGGEPLLNGVRRLVQAAADLRGDIGPGTAVDFVIQSNGLLLTRERLLALQEAGIRVGVSIDGGREATDRHRRTRSGGSTYDRLDRALGLLAEFPATYAGLLCVIDLDNDPVSTYEALLAHRPPVIDLLLPHGNWTHPPAGRGPGDDTPYGDWLVAVFDRWYGAPVVETRIRLFEQIITMTLGGASRLESIGLSPTAVVVVDVDGAVEQVDTLRTSYAGAVDTGFNVFDHSFDEALDHPDIVAQQSGAAALSPTCRACPIHRVCGGGYYPHRYREGHGFANPSVYCPDLKRLIGHIAGRVNRDLGAVRASR
jgi:uncharacterized protein